MSYFAELSSRGVVFPKQLYQRLWRWTSGAPGQAWLAGALAAALYWRTASPSIAWGDSPELVAAAYQAGVPHPTGYPIYMLLGHLAIRLLPWGDPAYRMNLLSGVFSAAAVGVAHRITQRLTGSRAAAWVTAAVLALAPLFWSQAVIAEVYPLSSLLTLLLVYAVLAWDQEGNPRYLALGAFVTGLNLAHHMSVGLLAPGLILFATTSRHAWEGLRRLPGLVLIMLAPLVFYLYLPIRAATDPWLNWGDCRTPGALVYHVTGRFYHEMAGGTPARDAARRRAELPALTVQQLGWTGSGLALLGAITLLWPARRRSARPGPAPLPGADAPVEESAGEPGPAAPPAGNGEPPPLAPAPPFRQDGGAWRWACLLLTWILASVFWAVTYWVFDYEVFYLPALLGASILAGIGAWRLFAATDWAIPRLVASPRTSVRLAWVLRALLVAAVTLPLLGRWKENDRHDDWSALRYARGVAQRMPPHALLFGMGDNYWFPLFYVKAVEGAMPDALVFNLFETRRPASYRLFARYRSRDFAVLPVAGYGAPGRLHSEYSFLRSLVDANIRRRPVCFLMDRELLENEEIRSIVAPYAYVNRTNLPLFEYYPEPPAPDFGGGPRAGATVRFQDGTTLVAFQAEYLEDAGAQWIRLRYRWRVEDRPLAEQITSRLWMTDLQGRWVERTRGEPRLQQTHWLGSGTLPAATPAIPVEFGEEYWVYAAPEDAGATYQVQLKLERRGYAVRALAGDYVTILGRVTIPPPPRPPYGTYR